MEPIVRNPKSVKDLAKEIKEACDRYWSREMTESELKEVVWFWAMNENRKLFRGPELNSTIRKIIGSKREELLNKMLVGFQNKMI